MLYTCVLVNLLSLVIIIIILACNKNFSMFLITWNSQKAGYVCMMVRAIQNRKLLRLYF